MANLTRETHPAFRVTETVNDAGFRSQLVDGNSADAEALEAQEFWAAIIGKSVVKAYTPPLNEDLQEFFGKDDSPDELIVASPLHDTRNNTPIREMYASCMDSHFSMYQGSKVFLPVLFRGNHDADAIIRVEQGDWSSTVPLHDTHERTPMTVFRSVRAILPSGFLFPITENLTQAQMDIMRRGISEAEPAGD